MEGLGSDAGRINLFQSARDKHGLTPVVIPRQLPD